MNVQDFFNAVMANTVATSKATEPHAWVDFGEDLEYVSGDNTDIPQHPVMLAPVEGKKLVEVDAVFHGGQITITWAIVPEDNTNERMYDTGEIDGALGYISLTGCHDSYDGARFFSMDDVYEVEEVHPEVVPVIQYTVKYN